MSSADYLAFALAIVAALISPGPAMLVMLRAGMARGRRAAVLTGLGRAAMAVIWTGLALLGLGALFAAVPALWIALKLAGAAYLFWLALSIWRAASRPLLAGRVGGHAAFATGVLTNLANPKAVLFIAAIFATLLPEALSVSESLRVMALHLVLEVTFYVAFALSLTAAPAQRAYLSAKAVLDRIAAVALVAVGLRLLADRA